MQKIRSHEMALLWRERRVRHERSFHLMRLCLECLQEVAMAPDKIFEHLCELAADGGGIQTQYAFDNAIRAGFVDWVQIPGLGRRPEWPDDHARGIGMQMENLPIEKSSV